MTLKRKYAWWLHLMILGVVLYLGDVSNVTCLIQPQHIPIDKQQLRGSGQIVFVPLDGFSNDALEKFTTYYNQKYGLTIEITPALPLPQSAFNAQRKQFVAEEIVSLVEQRFGSATPEREVVPIAFIDRDMYIQAYSWRYAFSYRQAGVGVVSSARMDHRFLGLWPVDQNTRESRLRKMVTKNIGVLYYNLPLSNHCRSVMYGKVGGPQELDFMGEDF